MPVARLVVQVALLAAALVVQAAASKVVLGRRKHTACRKGSTAVAAVAQQVQTGTWVQKELILHLAASWRLGSAPKNTYPMSLLQAWLALTFGSWPVEAVVAPAVPISVRKGSEAKASAMTSLARPGLGN